MQLEDIKGLGSTTIQRLHKGGVRTVEELALIDTRKAHIAGMDRDRLADLRRSAQRAIFVSAAGKFRAIAATARREAEDTAQAIDRLAKQATKNAVMAAKEADLYAAEALHHAEAAAADLAEFAAQKARAAQGAAKAQLQSFLSKFVGETGDKRALVDKYSELLQRAEKAAATAAERAAEAARRAREAGRSAASKARKKGRSLYQRLTGKQPRQT